MAFLAVSFTFLRLCCNYNTVKNTISRVAVTRTVVVNEKREEKPLFIQLRRSPSKKTRYPSTPRFRSPLTVRFYVRTQAASLQTSLRVPPLWVKGIEKFHRLSLLWQMPVFVPFVWSGAYRPYRWLEAMLVLEKIKKPVVRSRKSHFLDQPFESKLSEP